LVVRFAAASLVLFVAIGIGLSQYISRAFVQREERAARVHAQFVTDSILRYEISPRELAFLTPMSGDARNQMYRFVATRVLKWPIVRVKIWRSDGMIVFSDATQLIGQRLPVDGELRQAFANSTVINDVSDLTARENVTERSLASKLLETYVPST